MTINPASKTQLLGSELIGIGFGMIGRDYRFQSYCLISNRRIYPEIVQFHTAIDTISHELKF